MKAKSQMVGTLRLFVLPTTINHIHDSVMSHGQKEEVEEVEEETREVKEDMEDKMLICHRHINMTSTLLSTKYE